MSPEGRNRAGARSVDTNPPPHCGNNEKEKQMNTSFENTECSRCGVPVTELDGEDLEKEFADG